MPKTQVAFRLGELTLRKLDVLAELYGTKTSALAVAIDRLYLVEVGEELPGRGTDTPETDQKPDQK